MFLAIISSINAEPHDQLWRFITGGRIRSYPAVGRDNSVYIISDDRFIYSLTASGEQRWRYYLEERLSDCFAVGVDGTIYIGHRMGGISAINSHGGMIWRYATGGTIVFSPALRTDGTICLATAEGTLFAISHTGSLLWEYQLPGIPSSSPVIDADDSLIIPLTSGFVIAIEPWGELRWSIRVNGIPESPSIGGDGTIYIGTALGTLSAISQVPKIEWSTAFPGKLFSPVIGKNDVIYVCTNRGELAALNKTGAILWSLFLGEEPSGPCVLGETGTIFVSSASSTLFAVNPAGQIQWSEGVKGVLTEISLAPEEILYAGSSDWAVYAFPGERLAPEAWPMNQHDAQHSGRSTRIFRQTTIEERYKDDPDFIYFQSLLLSGNPELMEKGLREARSLLSEKKIKNEKPFLLYLLRKIAGFTVIEDNPLTRFPLRGFSSIREEACLLYMELGALEAGPIFLSILKNDQDFTMKTIAARCMGLLESDPDGDAVNAMAQLIATGAGTVIDDTFVREAIIAMRRIAKYNGLLPAAGISALFTIAEGGYSASMRKLAWETLLDLGTGK